MRVKRLIYPLFNTNVLLSQSQVNISKARIYPVRSSVMNGDMSLSTGFLQFVALLITLYEKYAK